MANIKNSEFEVIHYDKLRHLHIFLVNVLFRNMHEHSDFELNVVINGSAVIRCHHGEFRVKRGDVLLFNSYEPHEIASDTTEPVQLLSMQISNHFCREYFPRFHNVEFSATALHTVLDGQALGELKRMIFTATRSFYTERPGFAFTCVGQVCLLLSRLLDRIPHGMIDEQEYAARKRKTARIRRITGYIDQHYKEKIMLPDLARTEGITATYLSHFFHDTFHMTFQEYLNRLRLEKALILMKDPSLYLVDICMECGFSDNKYLNRMFMKKFGCTATEYRKKRIDPTGSETENQEPSSYSEFQYRQEDVLPILEKYRKENHEESFLFPLTDAVKDGIVI